MTAKEESILDIDTKQIKDVNLISISGSLDAFTAESLEKLIGEMHSDGQNKIIIDFSGLEYISSAGLGVFMSHIEDIRSEGGDIKMYGMNAKIFKIFDLLGFPMIFDITDSQDLAMEKFSGAA